MNLKEQMNEWLQGSSLKSIEKLGIWRKTYMSLIAGSAIYFINSVNLAKLLNFSKS